MPGIVIGSIFIFVLTMGEYGTVEVISQGAVTTVGVYVHSQIVGTQYPQGAASAVLLVFVLILGVFGITRFANLRERDLVEAVAPPVAARTQDRVVKRQYKPRRDWAKWGLSVYFVIFLIFLYAPMVLMAILSFQGYYGGVTFPFKGPVSFQWWQSIFQSQVGHQFTNADAIRAAGERSLWVSLAAGAIVALLAFSLSMAFRRRFRGDGLAFYLILLALMTPGFLLGLGTQIFWKTMNQETSLWHTALGTNTVWGIPFGFLVMVAIWNRYDDHIDEAARDLGASPARTFGEVTLPLVWTGIFGAFLFGFTLTWNDFDRTVLLVLDNTLPLQIVGLIQAAALRPDLYALGTATTLVSIAVIIAFLDRDRDPGQVPADDRAPRRGGARPRRRDRRRGRRASRRGLVRCAGSAP